MILAIRMLVQIYRIWEWGTRIANLLETIMSLITMSRDNGRWSLKIQHSLTIFAKQNTNTCTVKSKNWPVHFTNYRGRNERLQPSQVWGTVEHNDSGNIRTTRFKTEAGGLQNGLAQKWLGCVKAVHVRTGAGRGHDFLPNTRENFKYLRACL